MHYTIPLAKNLVTLVDEEDYPLVSQYKWHLQNTLNKNVHYVQTCVKIAGHSSTITLHRLLLNPPKGKVIDHINGDGLDNRRCNLRICTQSENKGNSRKQSNNTSGYKGIWFNRRSNIWIAEISFNRKRTYLGSAKSPIDAARKYDEGAKRIFGEFALLNFPQEAGAL